MQPVTAMLCGETTAFGQGTGDAGLLDSPPEAGFDALTRLASRSLKAPVALVSIVDQARDRQFFKSQLGLEEPWATARQTPISHSFCKYVKDLHAPLVVRNAPEHPLVCDNLAIRDLNVIAYLGVPITDPSGGALGALCVIDSKPRDWSDDDVELLRDLAQCVCDEIKLRSVIDSNIALVEELKRRHASVSRHNALRESIVLAFMAPNLSAEQRFHSLLAAGSKALGMDGGAIARISGIHGRPIFAAHADGTEVVLPRVKSGDGLFASHTNDGALFHEADVANSPMAGKRSLFGVTPGSLISAPLIQDGALFGVLEFSSARPRVPAWSDDDLSMISIISMFASTHLALHGQITTLQRSETALVGELLASRYHLSATG